MRKILNMGNYLNLKENLYAFKYIDLEISLVDLLKSIEYLFEESVSIFNVLRIV
jgi:hypothetical protein